MTLKDALEKAKEKGFNYFKVDDPQTDLEEKLEETVEVEGIPDYVSILNRGYGIFGIDGYILYRESVLVKSDDAFDKMLSDYMEVMCEAKRVKK